MRSDARVSRREADVLDLVAEHLTNAEIAARLYISERTVESHVSSLLRKLEVSDRRQLARSRPRSEPAESDPLPAAIGLLADAEHFVGRADERAVLRKQWRLASAGHTLVVIVSGEAGMGKSRLVAELAAEVHADGVTVLLGTCLEDGDQPYGPFAQAIADEAARLDPADVRRRAGDHADAIALLSPLMARMLRCGDVDQLERSMIVDGIRHWFETGASEGARILVVEDLHWASTTTRAVVQDLARRAGRAPLLILVTTRDSKPDLDADLATLLADLERIPAVTRLRLHGLDRGEVGQLVGASVHEAEAIVAETGGNPLLVTHMTSNVERGSLPVWLFRRDASLDAETRALLDLAAVFGSEFDADLLAAAHDMPLLGVLEALEQAEAAGLVVPHGGGAARFAFVHALFRSHRYVRLSPRRRLELHARVADALSTRADDDRSLAERARHACLAVPLGDARIAVGLTLEAAARAERAYAYDEAITTYERGLDAARSIDPPDPSVALALTVRIAAALHHRGDRTGLPMLLEVARRAQEVGDKDALVRAATAIPQFGAVGFIDPMPEGRAVTEAALAVLGDEESADRARLLTDLAAHWLFLDVDEALRIADRATSIARHLDDPEVLGAVLLSVRHMVSHPRHLEQRTHIGVELKELGRRLGSLVMTLGGSHTLAATHLHRGDLGAWRSEFDHFASVLGDRSLAYYQLQAINHRASRAWLDGDLDGAEELIAETVPLSIGIGAARVFSESTIVANRRLQGRHDELLARFERAARRSTDAWYRCCLAAVQARVGDQDAAGTTLEQLRDEGYSIREIHPWCVAVTELAEAAELVGDRHAAGYVLEVASSYARQLAVSGPSPNRPFDQALAQAALTLGDHAAAAEHARRAVAASRRRETPVFLVRELVLLAEASRRDGATDSAVRPLVAEATELAERIGAGVAVIDIERYGLPS